MYHKYTCTHAASQHSIVYYNLFVLTHSKDTNAPSNGGGGKVSPCLLDGVDEDFHRSDALLGFNRR